MFILMAVIFLVGYLGIVFEQKLRINKVGIALFTGALLWAIYALWGADVLPLGLDHNWNIFVAHHPNVNTHEEMRKFITEHELYGYLAQIASIILFILGAMGIVTVIDRYQGFKVITRHIFTHDRVKLLWIICITTFFMSAILDDLTTSIVMISLTRKFLSKKGNRLLFAGLIVIAANAGGAWSPIGDITTIILWIEGHISAPNIVMATFLPSLVSLLVPLLIVTFTMKGETERPEPVNDEDEEEFTTHAEQRFILILGAVIMISVPVFKMVTHLPPYAGMLLGLGLIWVVTDIMLRRHPHEDRRILSLTEIVHNMDAPTILYFVGILSAVSALTSVGDMELFARFLEKHIGNIYWINIMIAGISSLVDSVPIVAGAIGMFTMSPPGSVGYLADFMKDGHFWTFLTYCASTGGSLLIIGSATGLTAMAMEGISFGWYFRKISWMALLGFISGAVVYYLQSLI